MSGDFLPLYIFYKSRWVREICKSREKVSTTMFKIEGKSKVLVEIYDEEKVYGIILSTYLKTEVWRYVMMQQLQYKYKKHNLNEKVPTLIL